MTSGWNERKDTNNNIIISGGKMMGERSTLYPYKLIKETQVWSTVTQDNPI